MAQPITDQVGFLSEACRAVQELSASKNSLDKIRLDEKRLEKELEAEKKAVTDAISLTVKKRMEEINGSYDKEIAKGQDRLKRVRSKREGADKLKYEKQCSKNTNSYKVLNRKTFLVQIRRLRRHIKILLFREALP